LDAPNIILDHTTRQKHIGQALPNSLKISPLIHTGLQPGDERQEKIGGTVLTVCSSQGTEPVEYEYLHHQPDEKSHIT
jgi:hypothetical protein